MSTPIFDATQVIPQGERVAWPKGRYKVIVASTEVKPSSTGKGTLLALTFKSMEGPTQGQSLKSTINWKHEDSQTESIGRGELSALCHAVKVLKPLQFSDLHGIPLCIDVDTREVKKIVDGNEVKNTYNDLKGYRYEDGSVIVPVINSPASTSAPASAPPSWAGALATTPAAPPAQPVQAPAAPVPPAAVPETLYYVSHKGAAPEGAPLTKAQVLALGHPPAEYQVNVMGTQEWIKGTDFVPAVATQPAADVPPWIKAQQ